MDDDIENVQNEAVATFYSNDVISLSSELFWFDNENVDCEYRLIIIICPLSIFANGISIMALNSIFHCTSLYEIDMKVSQVCFAGSVLPSGERDDWINEL